MPSFSPAEMATILTRARIAYPAMTGAELELLNTLYNRAVSQGMGAFHLGTGASSGWGATFSYLLENSGLPRAAVAAYLVGMAEFMAGTIPSESWLDYMAAGVDAIIAAPGELVGKALDPLLGQGKPIAGALKSGAVIVGGIALLYVLPKLFSSKG